MVPLWLAMSFGADDLESASRPLPHPWDGAIEASELFVTQTRKLLSTNPRLALAVGEEALRQAEANRDEEGAVWALLRVAGAQAVLGLGSHVATTEQAAVRSQAGGTSVLRTRVLIAQMVVAFDRGEFAELLRLAHEGIVLSQAVGRTDLLQLCVSNSAAAFACVEEHASSLEMLHEARRLLRMDDAAPLRDYCVIDTNEASSRRQLAKRLIDQGQPVQAAVHRRAAVRAAQSALLVSKQGRDIYSLVAALDELVLVLLDENQVEEASAIVIAVRADWQQAIEVSQYLRGRFELIAAEVQARTQRGDNLIQNLRSVEQIDEPRFRSGDLRPRLLRLMSVAHEAAGNYRAALDAHKLWVDCEFRRRSGHAIERAKALEQTQLAFRNETVEFVTHDLRGSLVASIEHLSQVVLSAEGEQQRSSAAKAQDAAQRALSIADQALNIMRAEYMSLAQCKSVDISALVDDVCEQSIISAGLGVRVVRDLVQGCEVHGDFALLSRAISNLVQNALAHSPSNACVTVSVRRDGEEICVAVSDQGSGMPETIRMRLFQRYASLREQRSHGLGLALVSRVARLHKARIQVQTQPHQGTTVTLVLRSMT
jgi:signal transduction histidine kinase